MRIRILDAAAGELVEAARYVEEERLGYARRLLAVYEAKLRQIARFPESGRPIRDARAGLRSYAIRGFRYRIIVGVFDGVPTIVAIAHESRDPGYWRKRIP